jgi:two-component system response regulator FixJ
MRLKGENPETIRLPISNPSQHIVCLVDDDPSIRRSIGRLLESDGFMVRAFSEPEDFVTYIAKNDVEVAVLDIWMDRITGMELLAHLCARSPRVKAIFITGREDAAARATVMQAGAFAFFIKPFDDVQFLQAVRRAFSHRLAARGST